MDLYGWILYIKPLGPQYGAPHCTTLDNIAAISHDITSCFAPNLFEIDSVQWHAENSKE
jgi:hypothetical protein